MDIKNFCDNKPKVVALLVLILSIIGGGGLLVKHFNFSKQAKIKEVKTLQHAVSLKSLQSASSIGAEVSTSTVVKDDAVVIKVRGGKASCWYVPDPEDYTESVNDSNSCTEIKQVSGGTTYCTVHDYKDNGGDKIISTHITSNKITCSPLSCGQSYKMNQGIFGIFTYTGSLRSFDIVEVSSYDEDGNLINHIDTSSRTILTSIGNLRTENQSPADRGTYSCF